jgi:hypothetical protein
VETRDVKTHRLGRGEAGKGPGPGLPDVVVHGRPTCGWAARGEKIRAHHRTHAAPPEMAGPARRLLASTSEGACPDAQHTVPATAYTERSDVSTKGRGMVVAGWVASACATGDEWRAGPAWHRYGPGMAPGGAASISIGTRRAPNRSSGASIADGKRTPSAGPVNEGLRDCHHAGDARTPSSHESRTRGRVPSGRRRPPSQLLSTRMALSRMAVSNAGRALNTANRLAHSFTPSQAQLLTPHCRLHPRAAAGEELHSK